MKTTITRTALAAVQRHPLAMSPILLEYLLRGENIGRMREKGLLASPFHGALAEEDAGAVALAIAEAVGAGWLAKASGFYPALKLTPAGEAQLQVANGACTETAPDGAFRAYHRWRLGVSRRMRKPAYRIVPNAILNSLAARRPQTLDQLLLIPGLGKRRALRYHDELLAVGRELAESGEQ